MLYVWMKRVTVCMNVGICMQEGLTSLMLATQRRHLEVVDALLEAGADPDIIDNVRV